MCTDDVATGPSNTKHVPSTGHGLSLEQLLFDDYSLPGSNESPVSPYKELGLGSPSRVRLHSVLSSPVPPGLGLSVELTATMGSGKKRIRIQVTRRRT